MASGYWYHAASHYLRPCRFDSWQDYDGLVDIGFDKHFWVHHGIDRESAEAAGEQFDSNFFLMTGELQQLLLESMEALGGTASE